MLEPEKGKMTSPSSSPYLTRSKMRQVEFESGQHVNPPPPGFKVSNQANSTDDDATMAAMEDEDSIEALEELKGCNYLKLTEATTLESAWEASDLTRRKAQSVNRDFSSNTPCGPKSGSTRSPAKEGQIQHKDSGATVFVVIVFCAIGFVVGCASYFGAIQLPWSNPDAAPPQNNTFAKAAFEERFVELKKAFPNQDTKTWRIVRAAVLSVLDSNMEPVAPGAIAALGIEQAMDTADCFAKRLAVLLRDSCSDKGYVTLECRNYHGRRDDGDVKLELDGAVKAGLGSGRNHVVLVDRLHLLPALSGFQLFHGLCDNDNAPFKRAVYIFTSLLDDKFAVADLVDLQVTSAWEGQLDHATRSSLESRIGNNMIKITREPANVLSSACG